MNLLDKYLRKITESEKVKDNSKNYISKESVDKIDNIITSPLTEDEKELFEERAAIMEYDGGMSREDAEEAAMKIFSAMSLSGNA